MIDLSDEQRRIVPRAEVHDVGFEGRVVDPTPREAYTLAGRAAGLPTPETDEEAAHAAWQRFSEAEWWAGAGQR